MKLNRTIILIFIAFCVLSCGKNDQNEEKEYKVETDSTIDTKVDDSIRAVKESILRNKTYKIKETQVPNDSTVVIEKPVLDKSKITSEKTATLDKNELSFFYIKKILSDCKVGETLTQKELSTNHQIPKDAIKLVKSIKKISDTEIDVKWKSTWLIEKMSDAKLKDGKLKVNFNGNKMYTSGGAIGIKYNDKMYTDLVITGRTARIPTVKGFYWQIGK